MALIAMAVWDTEDNKRTLYTRKTINSLFHTVDFTKHRLIISDNGSCGATYAFYDFLKMKYPDLFDLNRIKIIFNNENLGTAEAINKAWFLRLPGENAIKMDNDVVIHHSNWIEEMEESIKREPKIGIIGLKRKDCWENPAHPDPFYRSKLVMLPHVPGEKWMIVEEVNHVMGTCQMYSSALLDKIGYLQQPALYGFDDAWAAVRCKIAGFTSAFLPHIDIDHIDTGDTPYQKWKEDHSGKLWDTYHKTIADWKSGKTSIYYDPFITAQDGK
jgi:GT2 family glycosyltransferase